MMEPENHLTPIEFKIIVLGAAGVGKTSLIQRYCYNYFQTQYKTTISLDIGTKVLCPFNTEYDLKLQIWDISGQERATHMSRVFYKDAQGVLIVFDMGSSESLDTGVLWKEQVEQCLPHVPCMLIGNKCDEIALVPYEDIQDVLRNYTFEAHYNTSAKKNINVEQCFTRLIKYILSQQPPTPRQASETPRSAQHQYKDRPSPRIIRLHRKQEEQRVRLLEHLEQNDTVCCWLV